MGKWIKSGDTTIGYQIMPERKKPVIGIMKGNELVVYGQFHDEESAEEFMENMKIFLTLRRHNNGC